MCGVCSEAARGQRRLLRGGQAGAWLRCVRRCLPRSRFPQQDLSRRFPGRGRDAPTPSPPTWPHNSRPRSGLGSKPASLSPLVLVPRCAPPPGHHQWVQPASPRGTQVHRGAQEQQPVPEGAPCGFSRGGLACSGRSGGWCGRAGRGQGRWAAATWRCGQSWGFALLPRLTGSALSRGALLGVGQGSRTVSVPWQCLGAGTQGEDVSGRRAS